MATIKLQLSKKRSKGNESEILMRLSVDREHVLRAKTGIYINSSYWNHSLAKIVIPRLHTSERKQLILLQSEIDSFKNYILQHCCEEDPQNINKQWLHDLIYIYHHGVQPSTSSDFESVFLYYVNTQVKTVHSKQLFKCLLNMLKRFELYYGHDFKLDLDLLSDKHLTAFEHFLRIEHTFFDKNKHCITHTHIYQKLPLMRTPQQRGDNTIFTILKRLRTFFNWAVKSGKTNNNPFNKYKLQECIYGTPYFMTVEERNKLAQYDLSHKPQLAVQRDIFIFQSLTGMRIGDLYELTKNNIVNGAIEYVPHKTLNHHAGTVRVPLCKEALSIIQKYLCQERVELLPFISEQKYNQAIKTMLRLAGITRVVTIINPTTRQEEQRPICDVASSHMARRNFIGNIYKKEQDPNAIAAMTGHVEGSRAFARYRTIDDELKRNLIATLE